MTRREAREQAFILVFEQALREEPMDEILHDAAEARDLIPSAFAEQEALGVEAHREEIDSTITENIRGWSLRRLSKVALALLRLADNVLSSVESDSAAKQQAVDQASAIAQNILDESNVESLLEAKGYADCVAYITPEDCSVVVSGTVEEADTLIVQEIVMEQTGLSADKIKIIGTN